MRRWIGLLVAGLGVLATPVQAQLRGFVNAAAGIAVSTSDDLPEGNGAGFGMQGEAGVWLPRVAIGGEVAQHNTTSDRKVKIFGAFLRIPSFTSGVVRPYLVTGIGAYRYSVDGFGSRTSVGASVGPGALFRLRGSPLSVLLEARFHTTFNRQAGLNTQQFFAIMGGAELRL